MSKLSFDALVRPKNASRQKTCKSFVAVSGRPKYIFGRNIYAQGVVGQVALDGCIDDFTSETSYLGLPIIRLENVPKDALVLILSGGKPLSAIERVESFGLECVDYFAFVKYSGLELKGILFLEDFQRDFTENRAEYQWVHQLLSDEESKVQFQKLVDFKVSYDVDCLRGFKDLERFQYFEEFLGLQVHGEVFCDVGSFDGYTSLQFIEHCPSYSSVHVFEPISQNMNEIKAKLAKFERINYHDSGLSNENKMLRFSVGGSQSRESVDGEELVSVSRLDDLDCGEVTFIKIDIEGGEKAAIEGAVETIKKYRPKLAIAVYHQASDIWAIPKMVLAVEPRYDLYLRHYTESVYETVMFFVPSG